LNNIPYPNNFPSLSEPQNHQTPPYFASNTLPSSSHGFSEIN
jgi:hypothetical protein